MPLATPAAEAYQATSNVSVDSSAEAGSDVTTLKGTGAWAEYPIRAAAAGDFAFTFRYRAALASGLKIGGGTVDLPASATWTEARANLRLEAGDQVLRVESALGTVELDAFSAALH